MDSGVDSVAILKKAEDEAQASIDSARLEGDAFVKEARERASAVLDDVVRDAAAAKLSVFASVKADNAPAVKAVLSQAEKEADRLRSKSIDEGVVSKCLKLFLGDCGV